MILNKFVENFIKNSSKIFKSSKKKMKISIDDMKKKCQIFIFLQRCFFNIKFCDIENDIFDVFTIKWTRAKNLQIE